MTTTLTRTTTVLSWLLDAGISPDRAGHHVEAGHVYLDGVRVADRDAPLAGGRVDLRIPAVPGRAVS
jgi:hypothetical protein